MQLHLSRSKMAVATTAGFHYRFKHDYAVAVTAGFHYAGNYFFNISRIQLIKVGGGGNCISSREGGGGGGGGAF